MNLHESFMQRALALARRGEGLTRPNPPVGAVLVQDGKIIAEGFHKKAGSPHAEVNCLKSAIGNRQSAIHNLTSATLYVTLEPCSTQGRTPPCTGLILEKQIGRVVVGCIDPNPAHAGRGIRILRRAGVEVITGVCRAEAETLIAPFAKRILTGMPYITLKLAITIDGRIADADGKSKWITGPQARVKVQELRRSADAILVGAGTVRADDPSLLPRPAKGRLPWRVVVGSTLPANAGVLTDGAAERTLVRSGSLKKILRDLAKRDVMHVLCEGGGELAGSLIRAGLVDEFAFFVAPSLLGGDGIPMVGKKGWPLAGMPRLNFQTVERCGEDLYIRALPVKNSQSGF
jgi:diaminohydroxyphosphoribosylaminopyrimidine deaminase/5-amino-6-(5-phosphoribosylamino)uracil reductase